MNQSPNWNQFAAPAPNAAQPAPAPWGAQPAAAPAPVAPPPGFAPQGWPGQSAAPVAPAQAFAPPPMAPHSATAAFGAGAFAGAQPMSGAKPCAQGDYILEIVETDTVTGMGGQGGLMWRMKYKVAHVFSGAQPIGSEVTDAQQGTTALQQKYVGEAMLDLSCAALNIPGPDALRQALAQQVPAGVDGWTEFSNALQKSGVPMSQYFPPNPLKGKYVRALVGQRTYTDKKTGQPKIAAEYRYAPAGQ